MKRKFTTQQLAALREIIALFNDDNGILQFNPEHPGKMTERELWEYLAKFEQFVSEVNEYKKKLMLFTDFLEVEWKP